MQGLVVQDGINRVKLPRENIKLLSSTVIAHPRIVVNIPSLSSMLHSLLQCLVPLLIAKCDLSDFLLDEVGEDLHSLPVLAIDRELATAGILVKGDKGTAL